MRLSQAKHLLWFGALGCLAGCTAIAAWALWPTRMGAATSAPTVGHVTAATAALPPLVTFAPAWKVDLRRNTGSRTQTAAAAHLQVKLAGTILDPQRPLALLAGPDGRTELKAVGENAGGAKVLQIQQNAVELSYLGQTVTLRLERPGGS